MYAFVEVEGWRVGDKRAPSQPPPVGEELGKRITNGEIYLIGKNTIYRREQEQYKSFRRVIRKNN